MDEGVQAATDAHVLVSALRSEVSALERHRAALQAKLDCFKNASAGTIDGAAAIGAWVAATAVEGSIKAPAHTRENAVAVMDESGEAAAATIIPDAQEARAARAEKKIRAAAALRQALTRGDRVAASMPVLAAAAAAADESRAVGEQLSTLAAAAEHAQETRRRAQEAFASRKAAVAAR